jgi:hypothetical protein
MSKVGLLTKDEEQFYGKLIAGELGVGGILGSALKLVAPMLLRIPDDNWGDRIPEPWQTYLETLTTMVYESLQDNGITVEEENEIVLYCTKVMNAEIDVKWIDENDEEAAFLYMWKWIASLLRKFVKKNSAKAIVE